MSYPKATSQPPPYPKGNNLLLDKTLVITAAAGSGIGFATAKRCLEEGASVLISDHHEKRLAAAAEELSGVAGSNVPHITCDVTVESEVQALFKKAEEVFGNIDVMINNAGLGGEKELIDMEDGEWHKVIDISLNSTMRCTRAALKHMVPNKSGSIVNNASVLGWRAQTGQSHYAAAKAGVMALSRCAAMEAAKSGVRVNCVAPSMAMHPNLAKSVPQEVLDALVEREAFKRPAEVWEVSNAIIFLASDLSSYMTGEVLSISSQHP